MPIFALVTLYFIAEIYVLIKVWDIYGFVNVLFALAAGFVLGIGIARSQGRFVLRSLQESLARGELPSDRTLHGLLMFFGGLLFMIPGFVSDFFALFLVVPGLRHLVLIYTRSQLAKKLKSGSFRIFGPGAGSAAGMGAGQGPTTFGGFGGQFGGFDFRKGPRDSSREAAPVEGWTRDVSPKIIDVAPVSSQHREVKPKDDTD